MMGKSPWMTGSLLGMMVLTGGPALAQMQPRYASPQSGAGQDDDDLTPPDEDVRAEPSQMPRADDDFSDVVGAEPSSDQSPLPTEERRRSAADFARDEESDALTNDCAIAARDEAEREGGYAEIRQMELPRETRNGFSIDGEVESRSSWRAQDGRLRHFTCTVVNGRIEDVYLRRDRTRRAE